MIRNTAVLVAGSTIAQGVTLALTPVITRIFAPDAFGMFAAVLALSGPLIAISTLRYHDAIVLPRADVAARAVFRLALGLVAGFSLLLGGVALLAGDGLAELFGFGNEPGLILVVPLMVALVGARRVLDAWLQRAGAFRRIAGSNITGAVTDRAISIGAGLLSASPWMLVAGKTGGIAGAILVMARARGADAPAAGHPDEAEFTTVRQAAARYASFARYSWSGLVLQLIRELPVIVFGATFGAGVAGLFMLARRVLMEPAILIGEALSKTYNERAARMRRDGEPLDGLTRSLVEYMLRWAVPPMAMVAVTAPEVFAIVFGEQWREAGVYAVLLMPAFLVGFAMQSLTRLFNVLERQKAMAGFSLLELAGVVAALAAGVGLGDAFAACGAYSLTVLLIGGYKMLWICARAGLPARGLVPVAGRTLAIALAWTLPLLWMRFGTQAGEWMLVIATAALCAVYVAWIAGTDERFRGAWRR